MGWDSNAPLMWVMPSSPALKSFWSPRIWGRCFFPTHRSKNHPPKHPPHHHHLPTTCQWPASSLVCCASFASLTSNIHHHDLCIQWYTWFDILMYVKLTYCCRSYRLSRPISAQPKLLWRSILQEMAVSYSISKCLHQLYPCILQCVCSVCVWDSVCACKIHCSASSFASSSFVCRSFRTASKLKICKLQTTSNRAMQLDQKIKKHISRWTCSRYPLCVIILPLTLPAQPLFHHHLLPSFVEPTTFSLENALFVQNKNAMQDFSTHPNKIIHQSIHHITITCQQLANSQPLHSFAAPL